MMPSIPTQLAKLAALEADYPVSVPGDYFDVAALHLPNGEEIVCGDGVSFDVWSPGGGRLLQTGLTCEQARAYIQQQDHQETRT